MIAGVSNMSRRKVLTNQHKANISKAMCGRPQTEYQKMRAREANTGKTLSEATKDKIRKKAAEAAQKVVTCPHCGHIGNGPVMRRWHFTNCRNI